MPGTRRKGNPEREINNLFATLNQEQQREKHDINGLYEGRLRSHAQNFEGIKRKWEDFTGMPLPKKLRTLEPEKENNGVPNNVKNNDSIAVDNQKPAAAKTVVKKSRAKKTVTVAPSVVSAPPAVMPPHPDDKINVDNMIVNDLRKELRKRQLSTSGRKAELQARLREHLAEEKQKREAEWATKHPVVEEENDDVVASTQSKQVKISNKKNVDEMDVVMEDANEAVEDVGMRSVSDEAELSVVKKGGKAAKDPPAATESEQVVSAKSSTNTSMRKEQQAAPKSALKPSKYTSSSVSKSTPEVLENVSSMHKQLLPTKVSDSSTDTTSAVANKSTKLQSSVQKNKISSTLPYTTTTPSFKTKVGGVSGSAKLLEKKKAHTAASEARKQRLAEMRQKAKPTVASASSATKPPPSHSKYATASSTLKKMASCSTLGENKPSRVAKMREKAAAEKNTEIVTTVAPVAPAPATKSATTSKPIAPLSSNTNNTMKRVSQVTSSQPAMKPSPSTALKSIHDPANKPNLSQPTKKPSPKKVEIKPLSPMQTYVMSDREEESDSESDSDDEYERQRPKKTIPEWAQKANLHRALERQFADGPNRLDPDKIFGEVLTCNLEEIFDKKKSRYQRRTSSGNWKQDHVSLSEKMAYKRTMGYIK